MIGLMYLKGLILTKQVHEKNMILVNYWYFKDVGFTYETYICNGCDDLMQKAIKLWCWFFFPIKGSDYRTYFWYMSKDDAINIMKNSNLNEKSGLL